MRVISPIATRKVRRTKFSFSHVCFFCFVFCRSMNENKSLSNNHWMRSGRKKKAEACVQCSMISSSSNLSWSAAWWSRKTQIRSSFSSTLKTSFFFFFSRSVCQLKAKAKAKEERKGERPHQLARLSLVRFYWTSAVGLAFAARQEQRK